MGGVTERFLRGLLPWVKAGDATTSNQNTMSDVGIGRDDTDTEVRFARRHTQQPLIQQPPIVLSDEQQFVFDQMENTDESMFITGGAGTGKSHLLRYFKKHTKRQGVVVVAPTGIAALNVGGQTIHSFFRFPPSDCLTSQSIARLFSSWLPSHIAKLQCVNALIIDEISMVRVDLLNAIDIVLQMSNSNRLPFGGKQVILFGDPFQLPPIVKDENLRKYFNAEYGSEFFFDAPAIGGNRIRCHILTKPFRQNDQTFIDILNRIRTGQRLPMDINNLNGNCCMETRPERPCITLVPLKSEAQRINTAELNNLRSRRHTYRATITGDFDHDEYPTERNLDLKVGAWVVILENRPPLWVNGTMGIITQLDRTLIRIMVKNQELTIDTKTWYNEETYYNPATKTLEQKIVGSFTQYPVKLAWALTIHKAQGQTYDEVAVDMGVRGAFTAGQTYVALSRCRGMNTLHLLRHIRHQDIFTDGRIVAFMQGGATTPTPTAPRLPDDSNGGNPTAPAVLLPQTPTTDQDLGDDGNTTADELQRLREENEKLKETIEKLQQEIQGLNDDLMGMSKGNESVQRTLPI